MKKFINGKYVDMTPDEIKKFETQNEDVPQSAETTPKVEERLFALENAIADLTIQTMGVE